MKQITDEELMIKIEELTKDYQGDIGYFYEVVGMVVVGRLFGWRVIRLVSSARSWRLACKMFGDLKEVLPERGLYAHKSLGLQFTDKAGEYWDYIKKIKPIPIEQRKFVQ